MSRPVIEIRDLHKAYGALEVLKGVDISAGTGDVVSLIGSSGSGKSTLIRCLNGLEFHDSGTIIVDGLEVEEDSKNLIRLRQTVGMVFQQFNLFPHLTILENLTIGPIKVQKISAAEAEARARKYLPRFTCVLIKISNVYRKWRLSAHTRARGRARACESGARGARAWRTALRAKSLRALRFRALRAAVRARAYTRVAPQP